MAAWSSRKMVQEEIEEQDNANNSTSRSTKSSYNWWSWRRPRFSNLSSFGWKRLDLQARIIDKLVFKLLYVLEGVVVVSTLCFFFLCCPREYSFFRFFDILSSSINSCDRPGNCLAKPRYHHPTV